MSNVPLCRSRVLYIGSAIPTATKDGLQGIQQPLKERYPANGTEVKGIDSWLSVWSNGLLLEYIDGSEKTEGAFHPIINLHYCAAVRCVDGRFGAEGERFIPLDSAPAYGHNSHHPPIFAAIFRRTTGIKVLECHAFICPDERIANSLVRCCFHSYADTAFLRIEDKLPGRKAIQNGSLGERPETPTSEEQQTSEQLTTDDNRDDIDWEERAIGQKTWQRRQQSADYDDMISTESSVHKKQTKRNKKNDTQSEVFENGTIIPYNEPARFRRSGSQPDINSRPPFEPHFPFHGPPHMHPHFMPPLQGHHPQGQHPPGPHHFRGRSMPPHMMFGPPPHQFGKQHQFHPGAVPPNFYGPPGGRPIPQHFHPMFMPPLHFGKHPQFHPMFMPPPHFAYPPQQRSAPTAPIIESIYDTYPRRGNYDETIYGPSNGTLPPNSTYKPTSGEHYEGFYESYKRPGKANGLHSDSDTSVDDSQFWDTYETGAYRKVNPNEKPGQNRNGTPKTQQKTQTYGDSTQSKRSDNHTYVQHSTPKIDTRIKRPSTPEIDYDAGNIIINEKSSTHQPKRQEAVF